MANDIIIKFISHNNSTPTSNCPKAQIRVAANLALGEVNKRSQLEGTKPNIFLYFLRDFCSSKQREKDGMDDYFGSRCQTKLERVGRSIVSMIYSSSTTEEDIVTNILEKIDKENSCLLMQNAASHDQIADHQITFSFRKMSDNPDHYSFSIHNTWALGNSKNFQNEEGVVIPVANTLINLTREQVILLAYSAVRMLPDLEDQRMVSVNEDGDNAIKKGGRALCETICSCSLLNSIIKFFKNLFDDAEKNKKVIRIGNPIIDKESKRITFPTSSEDMDGEPAIFDFANPTIQKKPRFFVDSENRKYLVDEQGQIYRWKDDGKCEKLSSKTCNWEELTDLEILERIKYDTPELDNGRLNIADFVRLINGKMPSRFIPENSSSVENINQKCNLIKRFEGFRNNIYPDDRSKAEFFARVQTSGNCVVKSTELALYEEMLSADENGKWRSFSKLSEPERKEAMERIKLTLFTERLDVFLQFFSEKIPTDPAKRAYRDQKIIAKLQSILGENFTCHHYNKLKEFINSMDQNANAFDDVLSWLKDNQKFEIGISEIDQLRGVINYFCDHQNVGKSPLDKYLDFFDWEDGVDEFPDTFSLSDVLFLQRMSGSLKVFFNKHVRGLELMNINELERAKRKAKLADLGSKLEKIDTLLERKRNQLVYKDLNGNNHIKAQCTSHFSELMFKPTSANTSTCRVSELYTGNWENIVDAKDELVKILDNKNQQTTIETLSNQIEQLSNLFPKEVIEGSDPIHLVDSFAFFRKYCNNCKIDIRDGLNKCKNIQDLQNLLENYESIGGNIHQAYLKINDSEPFDIQHDLATQNALALLQIHAFQIYQRIIELRQENLKNLTGVDRKLKIHEFCGSLNNQLFNDSYAARPRDFDRRIELCKMLDLISSPSKHREGNKNYPKKQVIPQSINEMYKKYFVEEIADKYEVPSAIKELHQALDKCRTSIKDSRNNILELVDKKLNKDVLKGEFNERIDKLTGVKKLLEDESKKQTDKLNKKKEEARQLSNELENAGEDLYQKSKKKEAEEKKLNEQDTNVKNKLNIFNDLTRKLRDLEKYKQYYENHEYNTAFNNIVFNFNEAKKNHQDANVAYLKVKKDYESAKDAHEKANKTYEACESKKRKIDIEVENLNLTIGKISNAKQEIENKLRQYISELREIKNENPNRNIDKEIEDEIKNLKNLITQHCYLASAYISCQDKNVGEDPHPHTRFSFHDYIINILEPSAFNIGNDEGLSKSNDLEVSNLIQCLTNRLRDGDPKKIVNFAEKCVKKFSQKSIEDYKKKLDLSNKLGNPNDLSSFSRLAYDVNIKTENLKLEIKDVIGKMSASEITYNNACKATFERMKENEIFELSNIKVCKNYEIENLIKVQKNPLSENLFQLDAFQGRDGQEAAKAFINYFNNVNHFSFDSLLKWIGCSENDASFADADEVCKQFRLENVTPYGLAGCGDIDQMYGIVANMNTSLLLSDDDCRVIEEASDVNINSDVLPGKCKVVRHTDINLREGEIFVHCNECCGYPFAVKNGIFKGEKIKPFPWINGIDDDIKDNQKLIKNKSGITPNMNQKVVKHQGYDNLVPIKRVTGFTAEAAGFNIDDILTAIQQNPQDLLTPPGKTKRSAAQLEDMLFAKRCLVKRIDSMEGNASDEDKDVYDPKIYTFAKLQEIKDSNEILRLIDSCKAFCQNTLLPVYKPFQANDSEDKEKVAVTFDPNKAKCFSTLTAFMSELFFQLHESAKNSPESRQNARAAMIEFIKDLDRLVLSQPIDLVEDVEISGRLDQLFESRGFALALLHDMDPDAFMKDYMLCGQAIHNAMMQRALLKNKDKTDPIQLKSMITGPVLREFNEEFFRKLHQKPQINNYGMDPISELEAESLNYAQKLMELTQKKAETIDELKELKRTLDEYLLARANRDGQDNIKFISDSRTYLHTVGSREVILFDCATYQGGPRESKSFEVTSFNKFITDNKKLNFLLKALGLENDSQIKFTKGENEGHFKVVLQSGPAAGNQFSFVFDEKKKVKSVINGNGEELIFPDEISDSSDINEIEKITISKELTEQYICWCKFDKFFGNIEKIELHSPQKINQCLYVGIPGMEFDELKFFNKKDYDNNYLNNSYELKNGTSVPYFVPFCASKDPLLESAFGHDVAAKMIVFARTSADTNDDIRSTASSNKEGRLLEFPTYLIDGKPLQLREQNGKLLSAGNSHFRVYSQDECVKAIQSISNDDQYSINLPFSAENPCLILGPNYDSAMPFSPGCREKFQLIFPYSKATDTLLSHNLNFGLYGAIVERKPISLARKDEEHQTMAGFSIEWTPGRNGIMDCWNLGTTDPTKKISRTVEMIARAAAQKDYVSALTWMNYLPTISPISATRGQDVDIMRNVILDFLLSKTDPSSEMSGLKLRLLKYWLMTDLQAPKKIKELNTKSDSNELGTFSQCLLTLFEMAISNRNYISEPFQFPYAEEKVLLEIFAKDDYLKSKFLFGVVNVIFRNRLNFVKEKLAEEKQTKKAPANFTILETRSSESFISPGEKQIFYNLLTHFASYNPRPRKNAPIDPMQGATSLDEVQKALQLAGTENDGQSQAAKTASHYAKELSDGLDKLRNDESYVPEDKDLLSSTIPTKVLQDGELFRKEMTAEIATKKRKLSEFLFFIGVSRAETVNMEGWAAKFLLGLRNMTVLQLPGNQGIRLRMSDGQELNLKSEKSLTELKETCRSLLLARALSNKNETIMNLASNLIKIQQEETKALQKQGPKAIEDRTQLASKWRQLNKEIESQQNMVTVDQNNNDIYYGSVLDRIHSGITRDDLLAFEAISGIRPRQQQADLLEKIFNGDISAFQLIMGGGKTAVMLAMMSYFISCLPEKPGEPTPTVPVILGHSAQMESLEGSIGKEYKERFGREVCIVHLDRAQLKNLEFLKKTLANLKAAKKKHSLVLIPANDLSKLDLAFTERMYSNERRKLLNEQIVLLKTELEKLKTNKANKAKEKEYTDAIERYTKDLEGLEKDETYEVMRDLLNFFKKDAVGLIDEADSSLDPTAEVNFPQGQETEPMSVTVDAITDLAALIGGVDGDNSTLFRMATNTQDTLTSQEFEEDVDKLVDRLWDSPWPDGQGGQTIRFSDWLKEEGFTRDEFRRALNSSDEKEGMRLANLLKKADKLLPKDDADIRRPYEYLAIVFGTVRNMLPSTLKKNANRGYGFTVRSYTLPNGKTLEKLELAPYVGAGMPSTNSIASDNVKASYLIQLMLCEEPNLILSPTNGSDRLVEMFVKNNMELILAEQERVNKARYGENVKQPVKEMFTEIFGEKYTPSVLLMLLKNRSTGDVGEQAYQLALAEMRTHLLANKKARLLLFKNAAPFLLRSHPARITSTSIDRCRYFGKVIACTGTTWNADTWSSELNHERLYNDPGTEGCILLKMGKDIENGKACCVKSSKATTTAILESALANESEEKRANMRMFLDSGGVFKTISTREAAEQTLRQMWSMGTKLSGMTYFQKFENRDGGEFRLLKPALVPSGDNPLEWKDCLLSDEPIANLQPSTLASAGVDSTMCGAFLDETHTTGTDMPMASNATGVLTVDINHTTIRDLTQAAMRFRQLLDGQSVSIVVVDSDGTMNDSDLTFSNILLRCIKNQADALMSQNLKSSMDKIRTAMKEIVNDYVLDAEGVDMKKATDIFSAFEPFFLKETSSNPLQSYVSAREFKNGDEIIYDDYMDQLNLFVSCLRQLQQKVGCQHHASKINKIFEASKQENGKLGKILVEVEELLKGDKFQAPLTDEESSVENDQEQQTEVDAQQTLEVESEQEEEADVEQTLQTEREALRNQLNELNSLDDYRPRGEMTHYNFNPNPDAPFCVEELKAHSVAKDAAKIRGKIQNESAQESNYGQIFPQNFFISDNQRYRTIPPCDLPINPLTPPAQFFMLTRPPKGSNKIKIVAITPDEAASAKNCQNNPDVAIYDMQGKLYAGGGQFNKDSIDNARNWINFYYGNFEVLLANDLSDWVQTNFIGKGDEEGEKKCLLAARWLMLWSFKKISTSDDNCINAQRKILRTFLNAATKSGLSSLVKKLKTLLVDAKTLVQDNRAKKNLDVTGILRASDFCLQDVSYEISSDVLKSEDLWKEDSNEQNFWSRLSPKTFAVLMSDHPDIADEICDRIMHSEAVDENDREKKSLANLLTVHRDKFLINARELDANTIHDLSSIWESFMDYVSGNDSFGFLSETGLREVYEDFYKSYDDSIKALCTKIVYTELSKTRLDPNGLTEEAIRENVEAAFTELRQEKGNFSFEFQDMEELAQKLEKRFSAYKVTDNGLWKRLSKILKQKVSQREDVDNEFKDQYTKYSNLMSKERAVRAICAWFFATVLVFPLLGVALYKAFSSKDRWAHSIFGTPITKTGQMIWLQNEIFRQYGEDHEEEKRKSNRKFLASLIDASLSHRKRIQEEMAEAA